MSVNDVIMYVMAGGVILGGVDLLLGNKKGYGKKFEEGFSFLGTLGLSMAGIICLAPLIAKLLKPVILPFYRLIGADPSMFASILAIDMGGYPLAMELAQNPLLGIYSGIIVASMFGCTLVFVIPIGFGMINKEDYSYFSKGLMIGLATMPIGTMVGGLTVGLPISLILCNNIPILFLSGVLIIGLYKIPEKMEHFFLVFGLGIKKITIFGLMISAFAYLTGREWIPGLGDLEEAMKTIVSICIVLLGSLPITHLLQKIMEKPFQKIGKRMGLDANAIAGVIIALATILPVFLMIKDMKPKGKVACVAYLVSAGSVFGAQLGFTMGTQPQWVGALIFAKLSAGIAAFFVALLCTKEMKTINKNG
ncbi:MAG: ethanolamine utilization protein EutH [Acetivibrio sp.]